MDILGASSLSHQGYRNREMIDWEELFPFTAGLEETAEDLAGRLRAREMAAVVTHGSKGKGDHRAHWVAHQLARLSPEQAENRLTLWGFVASSPGHPRPRFGNR